MMTVLNLLNASLSWHNREQWDKAICLLEHVFNDKLADLGALQEKALAVKKGIDAIDAFIQINTSEACPDCEKVCCMNKHGYYDHEDLIYIYALGLKPTAYKDKFRDSDPCQFISSQGCTIARAVRPFRCNWYFCTKLLNHIENGPAKPYREFISRFDKTITARKEMLDEFFRIAAAV